MYKILYVVGITTIVVIVGVMGFPVAKMFVGLQDYDLYVEAVIDNQQSTAVGQVLIQNTGSQPLSNVVVDFGKDDIINLGTIEVRDRVILTPPYGNNMEFVTVTADNHISVSKEYREENLKNLEH